MVSAISYPLYPHICTRCQGSILLLPGTLAHILGDPSRRTTPSLAVAFACPHCKQVQTLSKDGFVGDQMALAQTPWDTVFCKWIECEEGTCNIALPLYAQ